MIDEGRREAALGALRAFLTTPLDRLLSGEDGRGRALATFRTAAATVPAYAACLREQGVDPDEISTDADFERLPLTTRESYVGPVPAGRALPGRAARCGRHRRGLLRLDR